MVGADQPDDPLSAPYRSARHALPGGAERIGILVRRRDEDFQSARPPIRQRRNRPVRLVAVAIWANGPHGWPWQTVAELEPGEPQHRAGHHRGPVTNPAEERRCN